MLRVNYDVVKHTRWPAQRHVVISLDGSVCVADHVPFVISDKDGLVRVFDLRAYEGRIALRRLWPCGYEAPWVEVIMLLDEERAEAADQGQVGRRRATDYDPGLRVRWRHTMVTFTSRIREFDRSAVYLK